MKRFYLLLIMFSFLFACSDDKTEGIDQDEQTREYLMSGEWEWITTVEYEEGYGKTHYSLCVFTLNNFTYDESTIYYGNGDETGRIETLTIGTYSVNGSKVTLHVTKAGNTMTNRDDVYTLVGNKLIYDKNDEIVYTKR